MAQETQKPDFTEIARCIEVDPVMAYNRLNGSYWGAGLGKWVPAHMQAGMVRYVAFGIVPGSFLRAVLSNDLLEAGRMADDDNRRRLFDYVMFLINYAPTDCYGSRQAMQAWQERGGMLGRNPVEGVPC
jgi:hypothetical protein